MGEKKTRFLKEFDAEKLKNALDEIIAKRTAK